MDDVACRAMIESLSKLNHGAMDRRFAEDCRRFFERPNVPEAPFTMEDCLSWRGSQDPGPYLGVDLATADSPGTFLYALRDRLVYTAGSTDQVIQIISLCLEGPAQPAEPKKRPPAPEPSPEVWVATLYDQQELKGIHSLDGVMDYLDAMLHAGHFDEMKTLYENLDLSRVNPTQMVALMTMVPPRFPPEDQEAARGLWSYYPQFVLRCRDHVLDHRPDYSKNPDELFKGFLSTRGHTEV